LVHALYTLPNVAEKIMTVFLLDKVEPEGKGVLKDRYFSKDVLKNTFAGHM
jgi:hypothetical protein